MTKEEISAFCIDRLADILRIPRDTIDASAKFSRLGLDSAMTVYLQMDLEDKLDRELPLDVFYDHPSVDALSGYLADTRAARGGVTS